MIEVYSNLYVGTQDDGRQALTEGGWHIVHACKEPYHRAALGYTGRAAHKDDPEYLIAVRGSRLILNLVDVDDPKYVPDEIVDTALKFIAESVATNRVLVHCNKGQSRSPVLAMLHMQSQLPREFEAAEEAFAKVYPPYGPAKGMRECARKRWEAVRGE
jgi:hypothetical protein